MQHAKTPGRLDYAPQGQLPNAGRRCLPDYSSCPHRRWVLFLGMAPGHQEAARAEASTGVSEWHPQLRHLDHRGFVMQKRDRITYENVVKLFHLSLSDASARLGVSETYLKTRCRLLGISRWPYRKVPSPIRAPIHLAHDDHPTAETR